MLEVGPPNSSAGITWAALLTQAGFRDGRIPYRLRRLILFQTSNKKNNNKGSNALRIVVQNSLQKWIKSVWTLGCNVQRYHGGNKVG